MQILRQLLAIFLLYLECTHYVMSRGDGGNGVNWQQQDWNTGNSKGGGAPLGGWDDEVKNPWGDYPEDTSRWKLEDSIPGIPGKSYPSLDKIPETSFDCSRQKGPGYYGDVEAQCQVFHICQAGGRQNSFLCPVGTIFNQETFVCDWWFNVNCADISSHFGRNSNLFRGSDIGIDGVKIQHHSNSKGSDQLPPVGIPTWDQGDRGNWGMKGNVNQNRPMGQRQGSPDNKKGNRGQNRGNNRQEKGSSRMRSTTWPSRGGSNQNDPRKGANRNGEGPWGQQQRNEIGRNQKGMTQKGPTVNQNSRNNQKGDAAGDSQRRMGAPQRDSKRQRTDNRNKGGNQGMRSREYNRQSTNKGSNINSWSMGSQNLQNSEEGNMWGNNPINNSPQSFQGNSQWPNNAVEGNVHNNENTKGDNAQNQMNNPWRSNNMDEQFARINNFRENWNYDYNYNENSWSHRNKETNQYQNVENDYDYNS